MTERKSWTAEEDHILKYLHEVRGITKWNDVAITMKQEFSIFGRNGKQCRQRYHNHLDSKINKGQWTAQEDRVLFELHNIEGNRWAEIAKNLQGRTDNCVKNRYYLKMRKGIKNLNQFISKFFRKKFKFLKPIIIYKILQISDQISRNHLVHKKEVAQEAFNLKNHILQFCSTQQIEQANEIQKIQETISRINIFNKKNRRVSKKKHYDEESQQEDELISNNDALDRNRRKKIKQHDQEIPLRTGSFQTVHSVNREKQKPLQSEVMIQDMQCSIFDNDKSNQQSQLKEVKMVSLMSTLEKEVDENKTLKNFQANVGSNAQDYLEEFLRNDIFGLQ